jgi:hypothetical protein
MPSLRLITSLGVAAAVAGMAAAATTSFASGSEPDPPTYRGPVATASGGDAAPLVFPSIVNQRLLRTEAALTNATTFADQGNSASAITELKAARSNLAAAWAAEKYVIRTTPPPVAGDGAAGHASGGAPVGNGYAAPPDTGFAVLSLQQEVVTTALGLYGAGNASLNRAASTTIRGAVNDRAAAIAYIHTIPAPPPPDDRGKAGASGGAVASTWATTMPTVIPLLDDEIQAIRGTRALNKTLTPSVSTFLQSLVTRDKKTEATINTYWPPIVGDD